MRKRWSTDHALARSFAPGGIISARRQTREEKQAILRARAQALACEPPREQIAEESLHVLKFLLAHEQYGVELKYVREVYPLKDLTPLPGTPDFILGLANVRGQVLSIIDIKKLFGLPDKGLTDFNKIIVVQAPGMELGILADAVLGLERVPLSTVQRSLPTLKGVREQYLQGITPNSMVLLNVSKLLSIGRAAWRDA